MCFRAGKFCSINQIFRKIPDSEEVKSLHHPSLHIQWSYKFKCLLCIASFYSDINPVFCVLDPILWDLFEAFAFISTVHPYSLCGMFARHFSLNLILKPLFILCLFPPLPIYFSPFTSKVQRFIFTFSSPVVARVYSSWAFLYPSTLLKCFFSSGSHCFELKLVIKVG